MRRKIAIGRLSFPRRGEGEVFLVQKSAYALNPSSPAFAWLRRCRQSSPLAQGEEAERIAVALTLRWNPKADSVKHRKAFGIEE